MSGETIEAGELYYLPIHPDETSASLRSESLTARYLPLTEVILASLYGRYGSRDPLVRLAHFSSRCIDRGSPGKLPEADFENGAEKGRPLSGITPRGQVRGLIPSGLAVTAKTLQN